MSERFPMSYLRHLTDVRLPYPFFKIVSSIIEVLFAIPGVSCSPGGDIFKENNIFFNGFF